MKSLDYYTQLPLKSKAFEKRIATKKIVIHCSATEAGKPFTAANIDQWHLARGFASIGYHFVVHLDGTIIKGRPVHTIGAHASNENHDSIGICYIGGIKNGMPTDTRTDLQKAAMVELITMLLASYKDVEKVVGHYQLPKVAKACPSFDARAEYAGLLPAKQAVGAVKAVVGGVVAPEGVKAAVGAVKTVGVVKTVSKGAK